MRNLYGHFTVEMSDCFRAKVHKHCSFEQIIYHNCLLFTTRRNMNKLCIGTSPGEMCDFWIFSPSSAIDVVETKKDIG